MVPVSLLEILSRANVGVFVCICLYSCPVDPGPGVALVFQNTFSLLSAVAVAFVCWSCANMLRPPLGYYTLVVVEYYTADVFRAAVGYLDAVSVYDASETMIFWEMQVNDFQKLFSNAS